MSNKQALNVKDALSYLDQVKIQFSDNPDVYNRFLDIMKDFKSQAIDTPGVIERVSTLFKGHPALIQGFNTFLPPGYHIECSTNPHDPDSIRVTTPTGTTTSTIGPLDSHHLQQSGVNYHMYPHPPPASMMPLPHQQGPSLQPQTVPYHIGSPVGQPASQSTSQSVGQSVGINAPGSSSPNSQQGNGRKGPVEFNHAINYVNKIKNRFSTDPDTYKQFLEILQTYQKEQKPIQEVYSQVQVLFKNAPDLLEEFKQFLPDNSGNYPSGILFNALSQNALKPPHLIPPINPLSNGVSGHARLPPVGSFSQTATSISNDSYKKSTAGSSSSAVNNSSGQAIVSGSVGSSSMPKKKRSALPGSDRSPSSMLSSKSKKSKLLHKPPNDQVQPNSSLIPVKTEPTKVSDKQPLASPEELMFFEKVKKYIANKHSYNEFLKLINLYSQQILDTYSLVKKVQNFIGQNTELFEWFKQFVKYDEKDEIVQNTANSRPRVDLEGCISYGPSYRQLPPQEANLPCSGRDELCWEVLNDRWVSHPTWASEEAGFVSHKKNQFEEALHKCEEERYEYDMFIEANQHTIALLEPIERKIQHKMTSEEKTKYKLEPGLGGKSMIYQRVIKRVYDFDKGADVIEALHNNPATVVPVVLKRLKQKDEEWKRARREWNKIWREIDAKNYYKSLDHQGITFKNDDKKALTPKYLIAEIENLRREPNDDGEIPEYQYKFVFKDLEVFKDVARILFGYMDRSGTVAPSDRDKIEKFFKTFIPSFFDIPASFFDGMNHEDSSMLVDHEEPVANMPMTIDSVDADVDSGPLSSEPISGMWIQVSKESRENIRAVVANAGNGRLKKKSTSYFFGNNAFYCFFRFLQMLFSRLEQMKEGAQEKASNSLNKGQNVAATDLGIQNNRLDPEVDMDLNRGDPYTVMLELIEKQFDGEMELSTFEECLRYIYGTKAYIMFTVDKLVQNMTKYMQTLVSDSKSTSLISLFESNKQQQEQSNDRSHIMYQLHANNTIGYDEHTYRIDYDKEERVLTILLSGRDSSLGSAVSSEEQWAYYMYSYMSLNPTEGVSAKTERPFLKRNLPSVEGSERILPNVLTRNGLEIKICINSYHVFFVNNTEDSFRRLRPSVPSTKLQQDTVRRQELWNRWLRSREDADSMEM
ncbi:paired amphipathic helix protein pst1 [Rhizophagus clarus]|uniref:Paired amphipathic helix protein pst1 n=1 Tax=Rhizophagus clarus TaxID=94130 RepID=A0A8H3QCK2_9GLOM|nr:paired amphipathic helix protein pst1 [Rhizophagus clarus]